MVDILKGRYSRQGLWSLFLMCAFPLHAWTLLLAFRDLSWLTDRTNAWDAVGVASYGMVYAFLESLVIFLIMALLGFLVSLKWEPDRRIALLAVLVLIASLWAIISQLFFLLNISLPGAVLSFLVHNGHPLRIIYIVLVGVVGLTVLIPTFFIMRSQRTLQFVRGLIERLSLLTLFYLFFDVVGLIIVIIRNV